MLVFMRILDLSPLDELGNHDMLPKVKAVCPMNNPFDRDPECPDQIDDNGLSTC